MTPQTVQNVFIDALLPAHFSKPRLAPEKFFADLTSDLCQAGFSVEVLRRAASILRGERAGPFPKIPTVMAACWRAADALAEEAAQHLPDVGPASPGGAESRPCQPESEASPGQTRAESSGDQDAVKATASAGAA